MRVRDRFIESVDESEEKMLTQRIKYIRKQIKTLHKDLHNTCAIIEPCEYMLIWGALQRCLICIESCVSLVSEGYIGSANALLRQIYEFLVWAKAGISSDVATLEMLNAAFYNNDYHSHRITATGILRAITINVDGLSYSEAELKEQGKQLYHGYSLFTHASNISQQTPYKHENFYHFLNSCLSEISFLFDVFLLVFSQYLDVLDTPFLDLSEKEQRYLWAARCHAGTIKYQIPLYHKKLCEEQNIHESFLHVAFIERWTIDTGRLH